MTKWVRQMNQMKQQKPIVIDSLEQMRLASVALRRELGLPGGRLTPEQQKIYLEASEKLWRTKMFGDNLPVQRRNVSERN